jgi:hypothetical protein
MPAETHWDVWLAGVLLEYSRHVCGFSRTPEEAHDLFLPFMKDGLDKCERGFSIVDSEQATRQSGERLEQLCVDAISAEQTGQLEVRGWDEAHFRPGLSITTPCCACSMKSWTRGRAKAFCRCGSCALRQSLPLYHGGQSARASNKRAFSLARRMPQRTSVAATECESTPLRWRVTALTTLVRAIPM